MISQEAQSDAEDRSLLMPTIQSLLDSQGYTTRTITASACPNRPRNVHDPNTLHPSAQPASITLLPGMGIMLSTRFEMRWVSAMCTVSV